MLTTPNLMARSLSFAAGRLSLNLRGGAAAAAELSCRVHTEEMLTGGCSSLGQAFSRHLNHAADMCRWHAACTHALAAAAAAAAAAVHTILVHTLHC